MDDLARYNQSRWDELAQANVLYSRPYLDLTPQTARAIVDPDNLMGEVSGKDVLCLASGGGQQSAALALLGANVTVFDLSATQLQRDQQAADHYGLKVRLEQGDMRDLARFGDSSFDLVWHAYSINFVPDARPVFREVTRLLRGGGLYRVMFSNPFVFGLHEDWWNGQGYLLTSPYIDGAEAEAEDWDVEDENGAKQKMKGPREFRHTLSTIVNSLVANGCVILGLWEELTQDPAAPPGTWEHFKAIAPPWLTVWVMKRPEAF
jgi:SAM-dependent methyltransferase